MRYLLALVILLISIGAKVPTSHCHCHDKNPVKKQAECPFAKLRLLSATILQTTSYTFEVAAVAIIEEAPQPVQSVLYVKFEHPHTPSQAPPQHA